jgi:gluconokinase
VKPQTTPTLILIMGVCGTGKSTLGAALARHIDAPFIEADDFHPPANIEKMRSGTPLDDADRAGWLASLRRAAHHEVNQYGTAVLACSALKAAYRAELLRDLKGACLVVHLTADRNEIDRRLRQRHSEGGHYMPASLLDSQLAILEPPQPSEPGVSKVLTLSAYADLASQIEAVLSQLPV